MTEGAKANPVPKNGSKKGLFVVFAVLIVGIIGLTTANVLLFLNKGSSEPEGGEEDKIASCTDFNEYTDVVDCVRNNYEYTYEKTKTGANGCTGICYEYAKAAAAKLEEIEPVTIESTKLVYDSFIAAVNDDTSARGLTTMRNYKILELDLEKTYRSELLEDAIKIDNEEKTIDSCSNVMAFAIEADRMDVFEQYDAIKLEREKAAGIDSGRGRGEG